MTRKLTLTLIWPLMVLGLLPATVFAAAVADSAPAKTPSTKTHTAATASSATSEDDKVLFALGELLSRNAKSFELRAHEKQVVLSGFTAGLKGTASGADAESFVPKIQALQAARATEVAAKAKAAGKAYRELAAKTANTTTTASGIVITTLKAGAGAIPTAEDQVKVNYEGKLVDGTVFDSSIKRGQPATFPLKGVVPCWTEALQTMHVGAKNRVICPSDVAYGDRGRPPTIPGGATLVFEIELLGIVKVEAPPAAASPVVPTPPPATPASPPVSATPPAMPTSPHKR